MFVRQLAHAGFVYALMSVLPIGNSRARAQSYDMQYVDLSVYAMCVQDLGTQPLTVTAYATGSGFAPYVGYFRDWIDGLPGFVEEILYDDGTHGDQSAGDSIWTLTLVPDVSVPSRLRMSGGKFDYFLLTFGARDSSGNFLPSGNPIDSQYPLGVVDCSTPAPRVGVAAAMQATSSAISMVVPGFAGQADLPTLGRQFYAALPDVFDFLVVFHYGRTTGDAIPRSLRVRNSVQGLNLPVINDAALYGSAGQLQQIVFMNNNLDGTVVLHELGHRMGVDLTNPALNLTVGSNGTHWGYSTIKGQMEGAYDLILQGDGSYLVGNHDNTTEYAHQNYEDFMLYAWGLKPASSVAPQVFVADVNASLSFNSTIPSSSTTTVSIDDWITVYGPRVPDFTASQKSFRAAFIAVSDRPLNDAEAILLNLVAEHYGSASTGSLVVGGTFPIPDPPSFSVATGFAASLTTSVSDLVPQAPAPPTNLRVQ